MTNYYDAFGQPTTILQTMDGSFRYTSYYHDDAGNLVRLTHSDGPAFGYAYDALGRMTLVQEVNAVAGIDDLVIRYWYNAAGSRHAAVRGAGTGGFYTVYYRDALERPTILANDLPGTGDDAPIELGYNPAGQITSRSVSNVAYAAPGEANRSLAYQVNGLNQYREVSNRTYAYDANGNLAADGTPGAVGTTSYVYDVENRLVSASGFTNATLVYDPLGRLVRTSSPTGPTAWFLYDGDRMIAEYDGSGTLTRRYVHGPGADEPVAVYEGSGLGLANRRYTLPDERGSIAALINADGTPWWVNRYDSWGVPNADAEGRSTNQGRFQYTGQAWIPELGLSYYKARFYSPRLGRFMQVDPIGYEDQINLYAYAGNDPVNLIDPSGLKKVAKCIGSSEPICETIEVEGPDKEKRPPPGPAAPTPTGPGFATAGRAPPRGNSNVCRIGNKIMSVSDAAADASLHLTAAGLVVAGTGVVTGNPLAVGGGVALAQVGNIVGVGSGALQVVGGLAQGYGGGGYKNTAAGAVNIASGAVVSRALRGTIPRGYHNSARDSAERNNSVVGNVIGALQGLNEWLSPTQVQCPR